MTRSLLALALSFLAVGCVAAEPGDDFEGDDVDGGDWVGDGGDEEGETVDTSSDALKKGVNGSKCAASPYNCNIGGKSVDSRVPTAKGGVEWTVDDSEVLDGNGTSRGINKADHLKFNYGQIRKFNGQTYAFAMSTSPGLAGWVPTSAIKGEQSFMKRVGNVDAHRAGLAKMGCYEVTEPNTEAETKKFNTLAARKVVKEKGTNYTAKNIGAGPAGQAAGDYLPRERKDGQRSVNLIYTTPGFALGGAAVDHFPVGTKFQRLDVPTYDGPPSIEVPLYKLDGGKKVHYKDGKKDAYGKTYRQGRFTKRVGSMKFVYGYVKSATGDIRTGWMALDALRGSKGCE